jgi:AcrR family transcriptional regulator
VLAVLAGSHGWGYNVNRGSVFTIRNVSSVCQQMKRNPAVTSGTTATRATTATATATPAEQPGDDGEPRPLRADAVRNRQRILVAAEEIFAQRGAAAGMDDVAGAAGLGVGTLYRHFPTKEALLEAILLDRMQRLVAQGRTYLEADEPGDALFEFLGQFVAQSQSKQDMIDALAKGFDSDQMFQNPEARATVELLTEIAGQLLGAAQTAGDVRSDLTSADLLGLVLGPCMAPGNPLIAACSPQRMLAVVRDGLRPTQPQG